MKWVNGAPQVNRMLHDMYPDTLNRLLLINTPKIFTAVWRMFKPILPEVLP